MPPVLYDPDDLMNISVSSPCFRGRDLLVTSSYRVVSFGQNARCYKICVCLGSYLTQQYPPSHESPGWKVHSSVTGSCRGKAFSAVSLYLMPCLWVSALRTLWSSQDLKRRVWLRVSIPRSPSAILFGIWYWSQLGDELWLLSAAICKRRDLIKNKITSDSFYFFFFLQQIVCVCCPLFFTTCGDSGIVQCCSFR